MIGKRWTWLMAVLLCFSLAACAEKPEADVNGGKEKIIEDASDQAEESDAVTMPEDVFDEETGKEGQTHSGGMTESTKPDQGLTGEETPPDTQQQIPAGGIELPDDDWD